MNDATKYLEPCKTTQGDKDRDCFETEGDAERRAELLLHKYGSPLIPYHCQRCGKWHLCPKDRHTPSTTCLDCTDREGGNKQRYAMYEMAAKRAAIIFARDKIDLQIYACPHSSGWHLTKG